MNYFNPGFLNFLNELKENNNKEWFTENKPRYTQEVAEPFKKFVGALIDALSPFMDGMFVTPSECIYRINRDLRFSKDKTPYKTQVSALVSKNGKKDYTTPGLYVQFSSEDMRVYSGCHELNPKQIEKIRKHIFYNLEEFDSLTKDKAFRSTFGEIRGEKYKRVQAPFSEIVDEQPLILNKSFYYFKKYDPETALKDNLIEILVKDYQNCIPLNEFFLEALEE